MPRTKEQFEIIRKESRQKILDAALEVFANAGYHSATISMIAKTAGISQGLMYNYFKSKEEVLHCLMIDMIETLVIEYMPLKPGNELTPKDMINFINASVDIVLEKPNYWKLYFSIFVQPDVLALLMNKMMSKFEPYIRSIVSYFEAKGEKDPVTMMWYFSAVMDGVQLHCMIDPEKFPAEQVKKLLIKQFV